MSDPTDPPTDDDKAPSGDRSAAPRYVPVYQNRSPDSAGTCLRPLGLCELGGCCDACWYNPAHPRHSQGKS